MPNRELIAQASQAVASEPVAVNDHERKIIAALVTAQAESRTMKAAFEHQVDRTIEWMKAYEKSQADLAAARAERDERQDMANVGEALMETIKHNLSPHWSWNDCPSEVVVDLINERDEARAEAQALRVAFRSVIKHDTSFSWNGEKQCHVPWIMVEFAEVPSGEPNTAQGWRDRDAFDAAIDAARKESGE